MERTPTVERYLAAMRLHPSASLAELARFMDLGKPAVTRMVQRLTVAGMIARSRCSYCDAKVWVILGG